MIKEIKRQIIAAEAEGQKMAMFHYQILKNATRLENADPKHFCQQLELSKGYPIEFEKMIRLAKLLKKLGVGIKGKF